MNKRQRACAYITNQNKLLVIKPTDFPEADIQIPAGTVKNGINPSLAVIRESEEETGLKALEMVSFLGSAEYAMSKFGRPELQEVFFYHLSFPGEHQKNGGMLRPPAENMIPFVSISFGLPSQMGYQN